MDTGAPLVGRQDVLAYLGGVLARARTGSGGLVLVTGEAGIGKTRLVEEVTRQADGFAVHWTWCTAEQSAGSLRPWSQLLRGLTSSTRVAERVQASPALRGLLAGGGETDALSRAMLSADLLDVLRVATERQPMLLVLDDLHDAQSSTLRLLVDLAGQLRSSALVVVATARDSSAEWQGREQLRGLLLGQAHRLALGPLGLEEVRLLLGDRADQAERLLERTGGNALLVTEMARTPEDEPPASLRAMVMTRVARLSEDAQDVVAAAAVLGPRFRLDVLADASGRSLGDVSARLHEAVDASLVVLDASGTARFRHELVRDAVVGELPAADREARHRDSAAALATLLERGRDVEAAEVAAHLLRAGPDADPLPATVEAARRAAAMGAYDDAVRWFGTALDHHTDSGTRTVLLVERARALRGCGQPADARTDLLRAAAVAPTPELRTRAVLAMGTGPGGFEVDALDGEQAQLLRETLEALPEDALALRAQVLARLSVASSRVAEPDELLRLADEAVALARASGAGVAVAGALPARCAAAAGRPQVRQRLEHAAEIIALARDDAELELLGRRLRLLALLELGDRAGAEQEARAYELRAAAVRHPLFLWYVPLWKGFWALAEGRYDDCAAFSEEVARIGAGSENAWMLRVTQTWCRLGQSGDTAALAVLFAENDLSSQLGTWAVVARALALVQMGEAAEGLALLDTVASLVGELPRDSEWLAEMAQVTLVVAGTDHWLVPWVYDALLPYADLFVIEGIGAATRGPVRTFLALLAPDAATRRRHEEAAQVMLRRIGATGLLTAPVPATTGAGWVLEGDTWALSWKGRETRVRDSKGMRDLAALLAAQGKELGALDLYGPEAVLEHDTGEVLDAAARDAYKHRLRELEEQESLSEREALERDALLDQLAGAYGLGGRVRRTGSSAERARSAVTARVRDALKRVAALDPELGAHLTRSVRTGTFCSYSPETHVEWRLTP